MGPRALVALIAAAALVADLFIGWAWWAALVAAIMVLAVGELLGRALTMRTRPFAAAIEASLSPPPEPVQPLSRRESEVAILVARGLTNKEIARRLFRSERTIDNHVQHIYNRLGIDSRVGLTHWVRDRGLLANEHPE